MQTFWDALCYDAGNPFPTKFPTLNFHPLQVVSRRRDPQLKVGENYSYLFNRRPKTFANREFEHTFRSQQQRFNRLLKRIKND